MRYFLLIVIFLCAINAIFGDITVKEVKGNLKCVTLSNGQSYDPSSVGNEFSMNCNPQSNSYSRLTFDAMVDGNNNQRMTKSFFFSVLPGFGSQENMESTDGCNPNAYTNTFYRKECVKMGLPFRLNNGLGYSIFPSSDSSQLARILNLTAEELPHIIEGIEIEFSFGWPKWVYQLSNDPVFIFPFDYSFNINNSFEAYTDTVNAFNSGEQVVAFGGVNSSNYLGNAPVFSNCYPSIQDDSSRIGGYLGACFRAACNCSGTPGKPPSVPDYYTYEVDFVAPTGQVRKVLNNGQGRLSTDVVVTLYAVIKHRGNVILREQIFQTFSSDITSNNFNSVSFGNVGAYSGVNNQKNRLFSNVLQTQFGNGNINIDNILFPGVQTANSLFKMKIALNDGILNNDSLGGTLTKTGKIAAPLLSGGYIVDFLNDNDVITSPYRNNANSPYNTQGLPAQQCVPPDQWIYLSDAQIRNGVYLGNHFRNSCGKLGTSSAAFFTDNTLLQQYCCNDTLVTGKCLPGYSSDSFPSFNQIFNNCSLYVSDFAPPAWQAYNYYMIGRNSLNIQMPSQNVSGRDSLIYQNPSLDIELTIEISDILLTGLVGNNAFNSNIPPLSLAVSNDRNQWFVDDQPFGCIFDSFSGGIGVIYVQRVCNTGTNGGKANISIGFEGCQYIQYLNQSVSGMTFPVWSVPLTNQECTQQPWTLPIKVDLNYHNNITCNNIFFSSTYGSTKELNFPNVKCYNIPGFFTHRGNVPNLTFPLYDCKNCGCGDWGCWDYCQNYASNVCWWFVFIFPLTVVVCVCLGIIFTMISNCQKREDFFNRIREQEKTIS